MTSISLCVGPKDTEAGELPAGWKRVRLGEICVFMGGSQPPKHTFKREPAPAYVRLVQIQDFRRSDMAVYIPVAEARRTFDADDVMIGRYGPPVFQILRGLSGAYNVALMKAIPGEGLLKDYLFYLLQTSEIQRAVIGESQRSAGQSGVQKDLLESLQIKLPPLREQRRIANCLRDQLAAVTEACAAVQAQSEALDKLTHAVIRESLILVRVQAETNNPGPCTDTPHPVLVRSQPWQAGFQASHHPGHV